MDPENEVSPPTTSEDNGATEPQVVNAPWANYLEPLPESVRPLVEPVFKKWEADTTRKFQEVHSQYEPFKPYQEILPEFGSPENAQQALSLMQALNEDPQRVMQALIEAGYGTEQGIAEPEGESLEDGEYVDPRLAAVEEQANMLSQLYLAEQERIQAEAEDAELEGYLFNLQEANPDAFDREYVLAHMHLGMSGEQAIEKYKALIGSKTAPVAAPSSAPMLLGGGGGLPSGAINPAELSNKDTKALVAQMLAQAAQQT